MSWATATYGYVTHALVQNGPLRAGVAIATAANTATTTAVRMAAQNPSRVALEPVAELMAGSEVDTGCSFGIEVGAAWSSASEGVVLVALVLVIDAPSPQLI